MTAMTVSIEQKEIRGVTLKFFYTAITVIISITAAVVLTYINLRDGQNETRKIIQATSVTVENVKDEFQRQQRLQDDRITTIEQMQRQTDIRLTIMETKMGISNPFDK